MNMHFKVLFERVYCSDILVCKQLLAIIVKPCILELCGYQVLWMMKPFLSYSSKGCHVSVMQNVT